MGSPEPNLTSSTTPGLQIRVIGCCVAVPRSYWSAVPTLLFIYISQLLRDEDEGLIFCISATHHLGTSFPLFHEIFTRQVKMFGVTLNNLVARILW